MINSKWRRPIRWGAIALSALILLTTALIWRVWSSRHLAQWQMLGQVIQLEKDGVDEYSVQLLSSQLAILGRDEEIRRLDLYPHIEFPPLEVDAQKLTLNVVAWRDGLKQIANEHRIIMVMEDHFSSKHREMVGALLPMLRDGEQEFVLWVPSTTAYTIVVLDQNGILDSNTERVHDSVMVQRKQ